MVYKKYIKRNGKLYGPYTYHSRRVNGKVVSEYHGHYGSGGAAAHAGNAGGGKLNVFKKRRGPDGILRNTKHHKEFMIALLGIAIILSIIYLSPSSFDLRKVSGAITGNLIFSGELTPVNDSLEGFLRLSLREGELIPEDSKIVVESSSGETLEYALSEVVAEDSPAAAEGNFYISGKTLEGSGVGYGVPGRERLTPIVYFELDVTSETETVEGVTEDKQEVVGESLPQDEGSGSSSSSESLSKEEAVEGPSEGPLEESVEEVTEESVEEIVGEELTEEEGLPKVEPTEEVVESGVVGEIVEPESALTGDVVEETEEVITGDEPEEDGVEEVVEESEEESVDEEPAEETSEPNLIINLVGGFLNFFRLLTPTGQVVTGGPEGNFTNETIDEGSLEDEPAVEETVTEQTYRVISGQVVSGEVYEYLVSSGEDVKLVPGSVKTDSRVLSDSDVSFVFDEGVDGVRRVVVATDYTEAGNEGFGSEFLRAQGGIELLIDVSELEGIPTGEELNISLVYENQEIVSVSTEIVEGETAEFVEDTSPEISLSFTDRLELSAAEKAALTARFGNLSLATTKADVINERLVVRHELQDFWVEYSYEYDGVSAQDEVDAALKSRMDRDKVKWLKDLANKLIDEDAKAAEVFEDNEVETLIEETLLEEEIIDLETEDEIEEAAEEEISA